MPALRRPLDLLADRWRDLALRRHAYYLELYKSGRWTHYFTAQQFAERMRDVMKLTETWTKLAGNAQEHQEHQERDEASIRSAA